MINRLFEPFIIRNEHIKTKLFFAPINSGFFSNGFPTPDFFDFYGERSGRNIGICYIGNVAIDQKYVTNKNTAFFTNDNLSYWRKIATTISDKVSTPGIQLACSLSNIEPQKSWVLSNPKNYIELVQKEILAISSEDIEEIISLFINSAKIAYKIGFKVIQIHAGHGYFLSLLASKVFNKREDLFNYNEVSFLKKIINGIRNEMPEIILDVRFSLFEGIKTKEIELKEREIFINKIVNLDLDIISFSNGIYNIDKNLIYPDKNENNILFYDISCKFAKLYSHILWNIAGNMESKIMLENTPSNLSLSFGRQLICDPDFLTKINHKSSFSKIKKCCNCKCCHYYSNDSLNIRSSCFYNN